VKLPAISLWRPWGAAIILGLKTVETRRHGRFRGLVGRRIGIHNAKKWDREGLIEMSRYLSLENLKKMPLRNDPLHTPGAVIGTVRVIGHRRLALPDSSSALCQAAGLYGLFLAEPRRLPEPFPCRGRQGIWNVELPGS